MKIKLSTIAATALSVALLAGCAPTSMVQTQDDRPFIMFEAPRPQDIIFLDGLNMGSAADYKAGKAALRIEPGTHRLQVQRDGVIILEQKFYVTDGVGKTFSLGGAR